MTPEKREEMIKKTARHVAALNGHSDEWERFLDEAEDYLDAILPEIVEMCAIECADLMTPWDLYTPDAHYIAAANDGIRRCCEVIRNLAASDNLTGAKPSK